MIRATLTAIALASPAGAATAVWNPVEGHYDWIDVHAAIPLVPKGCRIVITAKTTDTDRVERIYDCAHDSPHVYAGPVTDFTPFTDTGRGSSTYGPASTGSSEASSHAGAWSGSVSTSTGDTFTSTYITEDCCCDPIEPPAPPAVPLPATGWLMLLGLGLLGIWKKERL